MKFRGTDREAVETRLSMTPMIDVVFLLLVFFILTFDPTVREGDFNIKMPLASEQPQDLIQTLEQPLYVRLRSDGDRNLAAIEVEYGVGNAHSYSSDPATPQGMFQALHNFVLANVAAGGKDLISGSEVEAEIEADYDLRYEHTVKAIEALSGYKNEKGEIVTLIEKIKFKDTRQR